MNNISSQASLWIILSLFSLQLSVVFVDCVQSPITKPIIDFCTGSSHGCAVFESKQMKCWGYGESYGASKNYGNVQSTIGNNLPFFNPGTSLTIEKVSCAYLSICILLNTGEVKCTGSNPYGQIGIGNTIDPIGESSGHVGDTLPVVNLGSGVNVTSIVSGMNHNCALTTEGKVKCFGSNGLGQLGLGDNTNRGTSSSDMGDNLPFLDFGTNIEVASIHCGFSAHHNCVILSAPAASAQKIKCWGFNGYWVLGYNDNRFRGVNVGEMGDNLPLVDLGTESRVKQLAIGYVWTCVLLIDNVLKCYGNGQSGQLGSGSTDISSAGNMVPSVPIDSGKIVKFVAAGQQHTCIVYDDSVTMKCVGYNAQGQLGQGDTQDRGITPETMIPNITAIDLGTGSLQIASIHTGQLFSCVVFIDSSIKCFGDNSIGQLAIGSHQNKGSGPNEMGQNLEFATLFSPTSAPTLPTDSPTQAPTKSPIPPTSAVPSLSPSVAPTFSPTPPTPPTFSPTRAPTFSPIIPINQITCAFTADNAIVSVYLNDVDVTPDVTDWSGNRGYAAALGDWTAPKFHTFIEPDETYTTGISFAFKIYEEDETASPFASGFVMGCTSSLGRGPWHELVSSPSDIWQAFASVSGNDSSSVDMLTQTIGDTFPKKLVQHWC